VFHSVYRGGPCNGAASARHESTRHRTGNAAKPMQGTCKRIRQALQPSRSVRDGRNGNTAPRCGATVRKRSRRNGSGRRRVRRADVAMRRTRRGRWSGEGEGGRSAWRPHRPLCAVVASFLRTTKCSACQRGQTAAAMRREGGRPIRGTAGIVPRGRTREGLAREEHR
jgi:hypothetical protein